MDQNEKNPDVRRKHLLTDAQLAAHAGVTAQDLGQRRRQGNGVRVHRTYIVVVSLVALALIVVAIAVASATM